MNRKDRRADARNMKKLTKSFNKRLTDEQFDKMLQQANDITIEKQVNDRILHFQETFADTITETLRENRISQERAEKITFKIFEKMLDKALKIERP